MDTAVSGGAIDEKALLPLPKPEVSGVGGWLAFFCVGLTVLAPLSTLPDLLKWREVASSGALESYPALGYICAVDVIVTGGLLLYGFAIGCMIWAGNPNGRRLARQFLLVRLFGSVLHAGSIPLMAHDLPPTVRDAFLAELPKTLLGSVIWFVIWWLYFRASKRVRNTYGPE